MATKTPILTASQRLGLELASEDELMRFPGGYWSIRGEPLIGGAASGRSPVRFVGGRTVQSLERLGLLERIWRDTKAWRDNRRITEAGRAALQEKPHA